MTFRSSKGAISFDSKYMFTADTTYNSKLCLSPYHLLPTDFSFVSKHFSVLRGDKPYSSSVSS